MKQMNAKVIQVICYITWLTNVVPVPKKDGKTSVCVDYRDLNMASSKYNFPLPNIHILVDNWAKQEMQSFVDYYAGYHQILMDERTLRNLLSPLHGELIATGLCHLVLKMLGQLTWGLWPPFSMIWCIKHKLIVCKIWENSWKECKHMISSLIQ